MRIVGIPAILFISAAGIVAIMGCISPSMGASFPLRRPRSSERVHGLPIG